MPHKYSHSQNYTKRITDIEEIRLFFQPLFAYKWLKAKSLIHYGTCICRLNLKYTSLSVSLCCAILNVTERKFDLKSQKMPHALEQRSPPSFSLPLPLAGFAFLKFAQHALNAVNTQMLLCDPPFS